jgi:zinc protease
VLAYVLDGGDSSRMSKRLVRGSQIAASAGVGYDPYDRLQTLFLLDGVPAEGHTIAEVKAALLAQLEEIQQAPVTQSELDRVKAQVVAGKVFERDSVFYQAMQIGTLETIGLEWQEMDRYAENIRKVTAEQVHAVAKKYIDPNKLTTAILEPQKIATATQKEKHNAH